MVQGTPSAGGQLLGLVVALGAAFPAASPLSLVGEGACWVGFVAGRLLLGLLVALGAVLATAAPPTLAGGGGAWGAAFAGRALLGLVVALGAALFPTVEASAFCFLAAGASSFAGVGALGVVGAVPVQLGLGAAPPSSLRLAPACTEAARFPLELGAGRGARRCRGGRRGEYFGNILGNLDSRPPFFRSWIRHCWR